MHPARPYPRTIVSIFLACSLAACGSENGEKKPAASTQAALPGTNPAPTTKCADFPAISPSEATEVFLDDIIDGKPGSYRLVYAGARSLVAFSPGNSLVANRLSVKISPNADIDRPDLRAEVECKDVDAIPEGSSSLHVSTSLMINRADGTMLGKPLVSAKFYGARTGRADSIEATYTKSSPTENFRDSRRRAEADGQEYLVYRRPDQSIEIRARKKSTKNDTSIELSMRFVYEYRP